MKIISITLSFLAALSYSVLTRSQDDSFLDLEFFGPSDFIENCPMESQMRIRSGDICASEGGGFAARRGSSSKHNALDLETTNPEGKIFAVADGTVKIASEWPNMGNVIFLDHGDGHFSIYAHLNDMDVSVTDNVSANSQIGTVGFTGNSDCLEENGIMPHLHFAAFRSVAMSEGEFPYSKPITQWKQEGDALPELNLGSVGPLNTKARLNALGCL